SESCITIGDEQRFCGIKVVQVPLRIMSATDAQSGVCSTVFESIYGLGFSGQFMTAYLVKETISELLFNLQYLKSRETLEFERICQLVFSAYRRIVDELNGHGFGNDLDIVLMGTCPASRRGRAALFYRDEGEDKLKWRPVLEETPFSYLAIGSGEQRFHETLRIHKKSQPRVHLAILESLQEVAESRDIPSVGGAIQYGDFDAGADFHLFGTLDFEKR